MMNLYVRYFDHDTLATDIQEVVAFLSSVKEIKFDDNAIERIQSFWDSDTSFPFRLKVSYSNYVLFLKTEATTLEEFKQLERMRKMQGEGRMSMAERKRTQMLMLNERHVGWYEASMTFKRVLVHPETGKCQYVDTRFRVRLKAESAVDCYNRIIEHLHNRQDLDPRCQYPSVKSNSFEWVFLDADKEAAEAAGEMSAPQGDAPEQETDL